MIRLTDEGQRHQGCGIRGIRRGERAEGCLGIPKTARITLFPEPFQIKPREAIRQIAVLRLAREFLL